MTLPETTTPEALADHMGWSERRVRDLARRLGACRILGNRMVLLGEDVAAIMEAAKPCPSKSIAVREALSGSIGERLPDVRFRGSTGTPDKETAQRIASAIEDKFYKRGLDGKEKALTWPRAVTLYIGAGKSSRYIARLVQYWGDATVASINAGSIRQSAIELYPKAKNSTRNRQVIVPMLAVINHCAELQLCPPLKMKRFKVETKIKKPVTLEWINAFKANADRVDVGTLALFLFATGARISEALSVRWVDIDFGKRTVLIRQSKLGNERVAHLPAGVMVALANLPRDREPFAIAYTTARDAWSRAVAAAGIEPLSFHSCRHGFATALHDKGIGVKTIAKVGGWKSAQHLFNTYLHADEDATVTDRLFDTPSDTAKTENKQDQEVKATK